MIVDCHTHLGLAGDSVSGEHLNASQSLDACIVLAESSGSANQILGEYVSQHPKMYGIGVVDPAKDDVSPETLEKLVQKHSLSGFVLYCGEHAFHPTHSKAMNFYHAAQKLNLPVFFCNWPLSSSKAVLEYARPSLIDAVARTFGELKIVIGAMGRPFIDETTAILSRHPNVFATLTIEPDKLWSVYNVVVKTSEAEVMDKLLFGSGYPRSCAQNCIEVLLGLNKIMADTNLPTVPREKIRGVVERDSLSLLGIVNK